LIEHGFNVPQAPKNCMEMFTAGGSFIEGRTANSFMGNGLWQFCPELPFRVFSPKSILHAIVVLLKEINPKSPWHVVSAPDEKCSNVHLSRAITSPPGISPARSSRPVSRHPHRAPR
jgi:hypothetical protein